MARDPETMSISEFKATCLAVLERVRQTGRSLVITKRGEPIAEIVPPPSSSVGASWLGSMRGSATITGDLVAPVVPVGEWKGSDQ